MKTIYIVALLALCSSCCRNYPCADTSKTEFQFNHMDQGYLTYTIPKGAIERKVAITKVDEEQHISKRLEYWLGETLVCTKILYKGGSERREYWRDGKMVAHKTFYGNGQLSQEVPYADGKKHGIMRCWYEDGKRMSISNFKNGQPEGHCRRWYRNGQMYQEHFWKDGKRHGVTRFWDKDGKMKEGYPQFYIEGNMVEKADYKEAMKTDATLPNN